MITWAQAALGCGIVVATLVIRTALGEIRRPGTAGRQWRFLTNRAAVVAGAASVAALGTAAAVTGLDPGHAVWAQLGGILTAFIVDRMMDRTPDTSHGRTARRRQRRRKEHEDRHRPRS